MALYAISYDLHRVRHYDPLWTALHELRAQRLLESFWVAELMGPAQVIRDILLQFMDGDDSLAVLELEPTAEWATSRALSGGIDWLWGHIPSHDRLAA